MNQCLIFLFSQPLDDEDTDEDEETDSDAEMAGNSLNSRTMHNGSSSAKRKRRRSSSRRELTDLKEQMYQVGTIHCSDEGFQVFSKFSSLAVDQAHMFAVADNNQMIIIIHY